MSARDLGLLALRLGIGGALFGHGAQKLFGWFGGGGPEGTAKFMDSAGFRPGDRNALMAGVTEAGGGVALALGLGTSSAAGAVTGTMAVAGSLQARNGFFATAGGFELPCVYALAATGLAITGPGRYSADHLTRSVLNRPWMGAVAFGAAAASAAYLIAQARRAKAADGDDED